MDCFSYCVSVFTVLVYFVPECLSVRCYVCSYSPDDKNNRTDKCTEENFQPQNVVTHECSLGCDTFVQYDANDDLEHWRRNCVSEGQPITQECQVNKILGWKQIRCTCDRDLCNQASNLYYANSTLVPLVLLLTVLWKLFCT